MGESNPTYKANELAAKLAGSTFATFADVERFIAWYDIHQCQTCWDETRNDEARELIRLREELRRMP